MTVLSVGERPGTRTGSVTGSECNETIVWLVQTNTPQESLYTILQSAAGQLPAYLQPHPENPFATLRKYSYKTAAETQGAVGAFDVTGEYSSAVLTQEDRDKENPDPTSRPARISWASRTVMEAVDRDIHGNAIVNAAGDYFDPPPERVASQWTISIEKDVAVVPTWWLTYADAINEAAFTIDGVSIAAGCAKISNPRISDEKRENLIDFRTISFDLELKTAPAGILYREGPDPVTSTTPTGWQLTTLNQGLKERTVSGEIETMTDDNGPLTSPAILEGDGGRNGAPTPSTSVHLVWDVAEKVDFSVIPGVGA